MTLAPWDYFFIPFTRQNFPDLFDPIWIAALVLLVLLLIVYQLETRRLHRHPRHLDQWEWLLWTGLITFSLLIVGAMFRFDFFLVLATLIVGLATLAWVQFRKFPPILAGYERGLARQRYYSREKFAHPESTIRARQAAARPKAQRRRRRR